VTGKKLTHGDVYQQSRSFAAALIASGVKRKDVICIMLPNCPDYSTALFGIWEAGGIACPINPGYTQGKQNSNSTALGKLELILKEILFLDELVELLRLSGSKLIITSQAFLPAALQAKKLCPELNSIIVTGGSREGCHTFEEMVKVDWRGTNFSKGSEMDTLGEVACLPFSSGTTGLPKAVQLTHSNLCSNLMQFTSPDVTVMRKLETGGEQEKIIGILPNFHAAGLLQTLASHLLGSSCLCIPQFVPGTFVQYIKRFQVGNVCSVTV